jgi:translation initiation factor IF-1
MKVMSESKVEVDARVKVKIKTHIDTVERIPRKKRLKKLWIQQLQTTESFEKSPSVANF